MFDGQKPVCNNFRKNTVLLLFTRLKGDNYEHKFIDGGCGHIYTCLRCGESYTSKKYSSIRSFATAFFQSIPTASIGHFIFTLPSSHPFFKNETRANYNRFFLAVKKTIDKLYPDIGYMMVLHNWSSRDPDEKNIHIHTILFGVNSNGEKVPIFTDLDSAREIYKSNLDIDTTPDIYLEYFKKDNIKKVYHVLRYVVRSPILDYCGDAGASVPLSIAYLARVNHFYRFHRIRHYGWMSPRRIGKTMKFLHIVKIDEKVSSEWKFDAIVFCHGNMSSGEITTQDGYIVYYNEISHFSDIYEPQTFFYDDSS